MPCVEEVPLDEKKGVLELDTDAVLIVPPVIQKHAEVDGSFVCKTRCSLLASSFLNLSGGEVGAFQLLVLFAPPPSSPKQQKI